MAILLQDLMLELLPICFYQFWNVLWMKVFFQGTEINYFDFVDVLMVFALNEPAIDFSFCEITQSSNGGLQDFLLQQLHRMFEGLNFQCHPFLLKELYNLFPFSLKFPSFHLHYSSCLQNDLGSNSYY